MLLISTAVQQRCFHLAGHCTCCPNRAAGSTALLLRLAVGFVRCCVSKHSVWCYFSHCKATVTARGSSSSSSSGPPAWLVVFSEAGCCQTQGHKGKWREWVEVGRAMTLRPCRTEAKLGKRSGRRVKCQLRGADLQMALSVTGKPTAHKPKLEPSAPPSIQDIHACNPGQALFRPAHSHRHPTWGPHITSSNTSPQGR